MTSNPLTPNVNVPLGEPRASPTRWPERVSRALSARQSSNCHCAHQKPYCVCMDCGIQISFAGGWELRV